MTEPNIGVAIFHGIGSQNPEYARSFVNTLGSSLAKLGAPAEAFVFHPVHWAHVLSGEETELLSKMNLGGLLDWPPVRRFVVEAMADAVAYRRGPANGWDAYHLIHWEVHVALASLRGKLRSSNASLVAIAHSLGSVILSDHIWDEQKGEGFGEDPFTRFETLSGIVTFGSTIPLFTLGLSQIQCIQFPSFRHSLSAEMLKSVRWNNYYDRDDVLGYPLRTLSASYAATVSGDVELSAGSPLTSWNPLSHNGYWAEKKFVDAVARQLADVYFVRKRAGG